MSSLLNIRSAHRCLHFPCRPRPTALRRAGRGEKRKRGNKNKNYTWTFPLNASLQRLQSRTEMCTAQSPRSPASAGIPAIPGHMLFCLKEVIRLTEVAKHKCYRGAEKRDVECNCYLPPEQIFEKKSPL